MSWRSFQFVDEDFEATFNNWQQGRYDNFSRRCTTINIVRWIGDEIGDCPTYDGTSYLHNFLIDMEDKVVKEQRISIVYIAFRYSPTRWWASHKGTIYSWNDAKISIQYHFLPPSQVN
jgi:hypothetical protein